MKHVFNKIVSVCILLYCTAAYASPKVVSIGMGTSGWEYPFRIVSSDCRTQSIYKSSEIGTSGNIAGMMLDLQTSPGQTIHNFIIRMQHTSANELTMLDPNGWTIVFRGDVPAGPTGWRMLKFSKTFEYNDVNNLMIDMSYNDITASSNGICSFTTVSGKRSAAAYSENNYDDPLYWKGTLSPTVRLFTRVPNIKLFFESAPAYVAVTGNGSTSLDYPLHCGSEDARMQCVYLAGEIVKAGTIKGIAVDVNLPTGQILNNFTIRMKHTSLQQTTAFEVDGWTTVYSANLPVLSAGKQFIMFSSPFNYNGNDNLMVDFSFNNSSSSTNGSCTASIVNNNRTVFAYSNSIAGNPLDWGGTLSPVVYACSKILNLQFCMDVKDTSIGVMSFNILHDKDTVPDEDMWHSGLEHDRCDRVCEMINSQSGAFGDKGPDIICLQEVFYNQICNIMQRSEQYNYYGLGKDDGKIAGDQCSILYRKDRFYRTDQGSFWLSETPDVIGSIYPGDDRARIVSWVKLFDTYTNRTYFVINLHLAPDDADARNYGATVVRSKIKELSGGLPVIATGDWNSHEYHNPYATIIGLNDPAGFQLVDSFRQKYPTMGENELSSHKWLGGTEGTRIDFITHSQWFADKSVSIERGEIYGRYPSDHYPVTATLQPVETMPADLNYDDSVNIEDVNIMMSAWLESGYTLVNDSINNGLLALYRFHETSGSTVTDVSPNDNDGTIVGDCYRRSNGVLGRAVEFPAISDSYGYVDINHNISGGSTYQQTLNQYSICAWVKLNGAPNELKTIIGNDVFTSYPGSVIVNVDTTSKIRIDMANDNPSHFYSNTALDIDKWYCIVVQYDSIQKTAKIYINGELDSTTNLITAVSAWIGPLEIGAYKNNTRCWYGYIDDLRIYNRILTESEIKYLSAGGFNTGSIDVMPSAYVDICSDISNCINFKDFAAFALFWLDSQYVPYQ
jgi:endonuclease/exonuclease/phosphatase family metal-dependent hydrolase